MVDALLACGCLTGGKFAVLGTLFGVWMVALILSRPRGGRPGVGTPADPMAPMAPGSPGADGDRGIDIRQVGINPEYVRPAREILTDPRRILESERQRSAMRAGMIVSVVMIVVMALGAMAFMIYLRHRAQMSPEMRQGAPESSPIESESITTPVKPVKPVEEDGASH